MTKKQLDYFFKRLKHWRNFFGQLDWEIRPGYDETESDTCRSEYDVAGRLVTIDHGNPDEDCFADKELNRTAFHEIVELLLVELRVMAECANNKQDVDKEIHKIVRTLENVML